MTNPTKTDTPIGAINICSNGKYANGIITAEYSSNDIIDIAVEVTSNHMGYFVFNMCANNNIMSDPTQDCFDE